MSQKIKKNALDTGTGPDQIVALNEHGQLPPVDGSLLKGVKGEVTYDVIINALGFVPAKVEQPVVKKEQPVLTLNEVKNQTGQYIDEAAETTRMKKASYGEGQLLVYQEKTEEATDYIAAGSPDSLDNFPLLKAEAQALDPSTPSAVQFSVPCFETRV